MCLIIDKPAGVDVPRDIIASAMEYNPDGVGIMFGGEVKRYLRIKPRKLERILNRLGVPAAIHFRWATHGTVTHDNVHPFPVRPGPAGAPVAYLMHNGVMSKYAPPGGKSAAVSDTRYFVSTFLEPLAASGIVCPKMIENEEPSQRFALMRADGSLHYTGPGWIDYLGLRFSNSYAWDCPSWLDPAAMRWASYLSKPRSGSPFLERGAGDDGEQLLPFPTSPKRGLSMSDDFDARDLADEVYSTVLCAEDFIDWNDAHLGRVLDPRDLYDLQVGALLLAEFLETATMREVLALYSVAVRDAA